MARERTVTSQQAPINTMTTKGNAYDEVKEIVQGSAELEGKRTEKGPVPGRKDDGEWHIGDCRQCREGNEEGERTIADTSAEVTQTFKRSRRERVKQRRERRDQEELP